MKLKLNLVFLIGYLVVLSFILKKILYIPLGLAFLLFLLDKKINEETRNMAYVIAALTPFPPILFIFLAYIPFSSFGFVLENSGFIKRYLFGFAVSVFSALMIYTLLMFFSLPLNIFTIFLAFYAPAVLMIYRQYKRKNIKNIFSIENNSYKIIMICLLFLFFAANVMLVNDKLFMSNGTYFYSKYNVVIKDIKEYNAFPFYSPNSAQGEQLFLLDVPALFGHIAFIKSFFPFTGPVLFWNAYSVFILLITMLGASVFISKIISGKNDVVSVYITALGSAAIVLSFMHIQLLESIKHFFALPIGFLMFALALNARKIFDLLIIAALQVLAFLVHPAQSVGIFLVSFFLFLLMQLGKGSMLRNFAIIKEELAKNKFKIIALLIIIFLMPLFYIVPALYYSDFMRGSYSPLNQYPGNAVSYVRDFFENNPISVKYPDLHRNDDRKIGLFFSAFGLVALFYSLLNFRNHDFKKANLFVLAFFLSLLVSSVIVNFSFISNMEYGQRMWIYEMTLLVVAISAMINSFRANAVRWVLLLVLLSGFLHSLPYVKTNLANIHNESFIGGQAYRQEIVFIKKLPADGRIITYGHFANAVDAGLNALTDRYLSRYEFKQFDTSRTVYEKIHTSNSWGANENLDKLSDLEFANYLRTGGYKYLFLNVCHPIGVKVANKVFPNFSYPIYQNQCNVILVLNNSNYAEKVNVVNLEEENTMKSKENGYFYVSINKNIKRYNAEDYVKGYAKIKNPEPLSFERPTPSVVEINGDFKDGGFVVFKEQYFPRWKAYMNGKEVPVLSTNNDLILMKTAEGNQILLKNALLPAEKISGFLSSLGIIAFIVFLVFFF